MKLSKHYLVILDLPPTLLKCARWCASLSRNDGRLCSELINRRLRRPSESLSPNILDVSLAAAVEAGGGILGLVTSPSSSSGFVAGGAISIEAPAGGALGAGCGSSMAATAFNSSGLITSRRLILRVRGGRVISAIEVDAVVELVVGSSCCCCCCWTIAVGSRKWGAVAGVGVVVIVDVAGRTSLLTTSWSSLGILGGIGSTNGKKKR